MPSFTITPLTEHTGAEVVGLDFKKPVDRETSQALNRAFVEHHVLVMREQHFAPDEFKAAVQLFGELQPHHPGRDVPHRPLEPSASAEGHNAVRG